METDFAALTVSARLLKALVDAGGRTLSLAEIAEASGYTSDGAADHDARNMASVLLSTNMRKAQPGSVWARVHRVGSGRYAYQVNGTVPTAAGTPPVSGAVDALVYGPPEPTDSDGWVVLGRDGDTVILKEPSGRLFVAKPLRTG